MTMMNLADIRKQIAAATEAIAKADTELKWELAASAADVAGMVDPTPASDLIGAGLAVRKGDWFGAGMSVASMVPYVGDALAKPAKAVRAAKKINALRETLAKMTAKLADLKKAEKQAEAAEVAAKEAKIAKEVAEKEAEKSAKLTADGQKSAARGGKDKDCKDCSSGSSQQAGNAKDGGTKGANTIDAGATEAAAVAGAPKVIRPLNPGTRFYVAPNGDILDANTYARNSGFRSGVRDKAWAGAVDKSTGLVRDPLSGKVMNSQAPWDMGHRPGMEYWKERDNAIGNWLDNRTHTPRKDFLDRMNDPARYRPELPASNRSHRAEDSSNDFWN